MMKRDRGILLLLCLFLSSCLLSGESTINKSIHVEDGAIKVDDLSSVNGSIKIGENCQVRGSCSTVNGSITVDDKSVVEDVSSVNGSVRIGQDCTIEGDAQTVNGDIYIEAGTKVEGEVQSVNGKIELEGVDVRRNLETINGGITLADKTIVGGDIIVKDNKGTSSRKRRLKIYLENKSVVEGDVVVEDRDIEVTVYISGGSEVKGEVINAEVVRR